MSHVCTFSLHGLKDVIVALEGPGEPLRAVLEGPGEPLRAVLEGPGEPLGETYSFQLMLFMI